MVLLGLCRPEKALGPKKGTRDEQCINMPTPVSAFVLSEGKELYEVPLLFHNWNKPYRCPQKEEYVHSHR